MIFQDPDCHFQREQEWWDLTSSALLLSVHRRVVSYFRTLDEGNVYFIQLLKEQFPWEMKGICLLSAEQMIKYCDEQKNQYPSWTLVSGYIFFNFTYNTFVYLTMIFCKYH